MRIGNWEIIKTIASGRWSTVALAKPYGCQSNNADYVIKFVDPGSDKFEFAKRMLIRELACSRLVTHASIISFLDGNPDHETPFLVSARHSGESLHSYQSGYRLVIDLRDKLTCFRRICEGVASFHMMGIRHGDLSPANLLVDIEGRQSLIVDLGLSEKVNPFRRESESVAGTWGYVAPECLQESMPINLSADVFSLGKTICEFFQHDLNPTTETSMYTPIRKSLQGLMDSMVNPNPLKRPTIQEVSVQISLMEIACLELDYRSAA